MFENTFKSPQAAQRAPESAASLSLLLQEPHQERQGAFWLALTVSGALVLLAGLAIFVFPNIGLISPYNAGFWLDVNASLLFWLSITQGMLALSLLIRAAHASWRFPLTRLLDMASLFGAGGILFVPLMLVVRYKIYSLGAQGMANSHNVWYMPGSLIWDAVPVLTLYGLGWAMLYLTSLPDWAALASRPEADERERKFFSRLSSWRVLWRDGWHSGRWIGSTTQWAVLRQAEGLLVVGGIVAFVMSQTVLAEDFEVSPARGWDSSVFAPLFAVGGLLGGCSLCVLTMTVINKFFAGKNVIEQRHYDNIGRFMIALGLVWFYFRWCDYITNWYGHIPDEWQIQDARTVAFPVLFLVEIGGCLFAPVFGNMIHRFRVSVTGLCTIAVLNLIGIGAQRWLDTVPIFHPNHSYDQMMPDDWGSPLVFLGLGAMLVLTYLIGSRYFPLVCWWGMNKNRQRSRLQKMGNAHVTVMMEDPAVWKN